MTEPNRLRTRWLVGLLAAFCLAVPAAAFSRAAEGEAAAPNRMGVTVRVALPIDGRTAKVAEDMMRRAVERAAAEQARLTLIVEFVVPPDQAEFGRGSEFGAALQLAEFLSSDALNGVQTVAYLPQSIQGHAVLVALACDKIIMAPQASLGPAGVDEKVVSEARRASYVDIANRRKTIPATVAVWLLDPSQEVLVVESEVAREYLSPDELPEFEKAHVVTSARPLFDPTHPETSYAAQRGQLTGEEARRLTLVSYLATAPEEVAEALELPLRDLSEDPSLMGGWKAMRVELKDAITPDSARRVQKAIELATRREGVNFICLWIDSPGGSVVGSMELANALGGYDPGKVRVVAYVTNQALADAALVALACDDVVMQRGATLGGPGAVDLSPLDVKQIVEAVRDPQGPWRHRSWSLVAALVDPNLTVYRCTRQGETTYFSDAELEEYRNRHPQAAAWTKGEPVTIAGQPLELDAERALQLGLAYGVVDSFDEFRTLYRLEDEPEMVEPGWAEDLIAALASPGVAVLLLMIGFTALYVEVHTPGIGIGGFLATLCFVLFFWSRFLNHTANELEVCLFLVGVVCLALEIFVLPGFGIFGFGGGALILVSLVLASQTFVVPHNSYQFAQLQQSLMTVALAAVGCVIAAVFLRHWLPRSRLFGGVLLEPPKGAEADTISRRESLVDLHDVVVGQRGTTTTPLLPGGRARFGDRFVDVTSDGELIDKGTLVEVAKIQGHRIEVRPVKA